MSGSGPSSEEKEARPLPDGDQPYSPTLSLSPSRSVEDMDWDSNLPGVKRLFEPPSQKRKAGGVPAKEDKTDSSSSSSSSSEDEEDDRKVVGSSSSSDDQAKEEEEVKDQGKEKEEEPGLKPPALCKAAGSAEGQAAGPQGNATGAMSASEKAKLFLEKKREENVLEIRRRLGQDNMIYNAIQMNTKRGNVAADLLGGPKSTVENMRGLVDIGDGRILSGGLKIDIADKKVVSTSFDQEWRCIACNHPNNRPAFGVRGRATVIDTLHAVIIADQSVPAMLPVSSD
jgi:hypothetical protein